MVYFIQAGENGPIKIGKSVDPQKRLAQLQTSSERPLRILLTLVGDESRECAYHKLWAEHRIRGEWFDPAPEIVEYVRSKTNNTLREFKTIVVDGLAYPLFGCTTRPNRDFPNCLVGEFRCKLCGNIHQHSIEGINPSHRVAHCPSGTPKADMGYFIYPAMDVKASVGDWELIGFT